MGMNYDHDFYKDRHRNTVNSASTILSIVIDILPKVNSAIDFGCGVGTWLSVLKEKGISEIQGLDGNWVEQDLLEIPKHCFQHVNFEEKISLERNFDLAISLEVAEHLTPENAKQFVGSLTNASDFILFSAAIPLQGGENHINEQWPDYWIDLFNEKKYVALDLIRKTIWYDKTIPTWYRQNILMFVKQEKLKELKLPNLDIGSQYLPIAVVHPDTYLTKINKIPSVKGSVKLLWHAVKRWIKKKISKNVS